MDDRVLRRIVAEAVAGAHVDPAKDWAERVEFGPAQLERVMEQYRNPNLAQNVEEAAMAVLKAALDPAEPNVHDAMAAVALRERLEAQKGITYAELGGILEVIDEQPLHREDIY